jgi:glycogen debranching enzyme
VNEHLWVCASAGCADGAGYYGAYNVTTRAQIASRTWQAALPTWAGLAANASRAVASLAAASLPDLMSDYGLRSTSRADARYSNANTIDPYSNWRGPVWVNAAVLHAHALRAQGFGDAAGALADAVVHTLAQDLRATGEWHESYDSDTGAGLAAPGFLSWDTLGASVQDDVQRGVDPFALG